MLEAAAGISEAVAILREFPNASDEEILRKLLAAGVERVVASRLVEFLPLAYLRLILSDSGIRFCDRFQRKLADGSLSAECPLDSEPLWAEIVSFARSEKHSGITGDALLVIAGRSSEFDAVNQLANRGSKLNEIVLTPTVFNWPEEGLTL
jgi:hypothetical protein